MAEITARLLDPSLATRQGAFFQFHETLAEAARFAAFKEPVMRCTDFLGRLKVLADRYGVEAETDYEDIANILQQIIDAIDFEYDNPALLPLIEQLAAEYGDVGTVEAVADESAEYLHQLVRWMLTDKGVSLDYLAPLYDAFTDDSVEQFDVFTLNHDRVLDRGLDERRIAFSDGFEEPWGTLLLWSDTYSVPTRRLFKLHGAVDWFRYDLNLGDWSGQVSARSAPDGDPWNPKGPDHRSLGARGFPCEGRAQFLAGTFTKILAYPTGLYADQHGHFHESLREADALLVVGYGFGDKAINARLIAWMNTPRARRRMVVVDPAAERLPERARFAVGSKWAGWVRAGSLMPIGEALGERTPWADLRQALATR